MEFRATQKKHFDVGGFFLCESDLEKLKNDQIFKDNK